MGDEILHAKFGPSSLKLFEGCPHYRKGPEHAGAIAAAASGSFQHNVGEAYAHLVKNSGRNSKYSEPLFQKTWKKTMDDPRTTHEFDPEWIEQEMAYARVVCKHIHPLVRDPNCTVEVEVRSDSYVTWGTCDLLVISPSGLSAKVRDWKFGFIEVEPPAGNIQGWAYMAGIFERYPDLITIDIGFLQPKLDTECETKQFHRDQLPEMIDRLARVKTRGQDGETHEEGMHDVGENCNYCGRLSTCPAFNKTFSKGAKEMISQDEKGKNMEWPSSFDTVEDRGAAMVIMSLMEKAIAQNKALLANLHVDGLEAEGHSLISNKGQRKIYAKDRVTAFKHLLGDNVSNYVEETLGVDFVKRMASAMDFSLGKLSAEQKELVETEVTQGKPFHFLRRNKS